MNSRKAKKKIVGYLVDQLEAQSTAGDEKEKASAADYERLCEAELQLAKELRERYRISEN